MKKFEKPSCEFVKFSSNVLTTSVCGCWDGDEDTGAGTNCTADGTPQCTCQVNYDPAVANCITP